MSPRFLETKRTSALLSQVARDRVRRVCGQTGLGQSKVIDALIRLGDEEQVERLVTEDALIRERWDEAGQ